MATKTIGLAGNYIKYLYRKFVENCLIIVSKIKNLEETNIKILTAKLQNFETAEAFNRMKMMRLLWPSNEQVAFLMCLIYIIDGNITKAKIIIDKFINTSKYKFSKLQQIIQNNSEDARDLFYSGLNLLEISDIYNESF